MTERLQARDIQMTCAGSSRVGLVRGALSGLVGGAVRELQRARGLGTDGAT